MNAELLVLRLIHILGGIFWVGGTLLMTLFLMPALAAAGPAAGSVMAEMQRRRIMVVMPIVALLTLLTGLRLIWIAAAGQHAAYFSSGPGRTYAVSALAAVTAFLIGYFVARPAMMRVGQLGAGMATAAPDARPAMLEQLTALRRRVSIATGVVTTLLVLAAAGMAIGRYVG